MVEGFDGDLRERSEGKGREGRDKQQEARQAAAWFLVADWFSHCHHRSSIVFVRLPLVGNRVYSTPLCLHFPCPLPLCVYRCPSASAGDWAALPAAQGVLPHRRRTGVCVWVGGSKGGRGRRDKHTHTHPHNLDASCSSSLYTHTSSEHSLLLTPRYLLPMTLQPSSLPPPSVLPLSHRYIVTLVTGCWQDPP